MKNSFNAIRRMDPRLSATKWRDLSTFGGRGDDKGGKEYYIADLTALADQYNLDRLPYSLKILLENLLRFEDGETVTAEDIKALANWDAKAKPSQEIAYRQCDHRKRFYLFTLVNRCIRNQGT